MLQLSIDFSKGFDSISRQRIKCILTAYGIPDKIVWLIMIPYTDTKAHMITPDSPSNNFAITTGVLEGDTLAPYLS